MKQGRKRYTYFKIHQKGPAIDDRQLSNAIWKNMLSLYGEILVSETRFFLNEYDAEKGTGYFQCNAARSQEVISAAVLLESVEKTSISLEPIKTSGTIKALLKKV